jgi:IPT/TIG domain
VPITSPVLAVGPSGGVSAEIFGYGFGSDVGSPPQVQMGSASASVEVNKLFPAEYMFGYPIPLDHIRVTVPSGSPGAADIIITSSAGTGKIAGSIHYAQSVNVPPTLAGSFQMLGLALTPDGSKLLAANYVDNSVAIINPDDPCTSQVVPIVPAGWALGFLGPTQLAASNVNHALVAVSGSSAAGVGAGYLFDLDLSRLSVKAAYGPFNTGIADDFLGSSRDGSKLVVGMPEQGVFVLDSATTTWSSGPPRNPFEVAASGDGNVFASDDMAPPSNEATSLSFFDSNANLIAVTGQPEYLAPAPALAGIKLNDAGSLAYVGVFFYIPIADSTYSQDYVDIYDVQHHELRERVFLAEKLPPEEATQNGLAIDPTSQNIFLITTSGLTIITLDSVPLSIGSVTPNSGASGTKVTIRGSDFTPQTTATCNGTAATLTFMDGDTMQLALPASLSSGPASVALANPDGSTYNLDVAFDVTV